MALDVRTVFELNASATANNVNGGGFNPFNSNMLTDLTTDTNTGNTNSPVVSSGSYNFAAGDVGNWLYIKSGTDWTPGWYQIASVASNKATLSAAVGAAIQVTTGGGAPSPRYNTNTVAGCATTGTPTNGVFTIDYSQSTAAIKTNTDLACTAGSTTITATTGFTPVMVGNIVHLTALTGTGAIVGWYEIVSYTNATTVVLDRTPTNGVNNITAGTFYVGGAMSMNSTLDDDFFEIMSGTNGTGGNRIFIKNGSFTWGEAVSMTTTGGTLAPICIEGYNTLRGDLNNVISNANKPIINVGSNSWQLNTAWHVYNLVIYGSAGTMYNPVSNGDLVNCKLVNTSTTANRIAYSPSSTGNTCLKNEIICYRGRAISNANSGNLSLYNYLHDSDQGIIHNTSATTTIVGNIIANNVTYAINAATGITGDSAILQNTLYGAENKLGIGINFATGTTQIVFSNNILYGFTTGVVAADTQTILYDDYNNYYNNTNDVSAAGQWQKGLGDLAVNPSFTSMSQFTGTGATSSTNVLTYSTGGFNAAVTDGVTHVYLVSGSGTGFAAGIYPVSSHTDTTLTFATPLGTAMNITSSGSGSNIVFQFTYGLNFSVGTNLKATGYPGIFPGSLTTGYLDIGAVQRQEQGSGGSGGFFYS